MTPQLKKLLIIVLILIGLGLSLIAYRLFTEQGKFCGGIAGNLPENQCSFPLRCVLTYRMPDSPGTCQF